ncbi:hypothetical protein OCU04_012745 [Sclerotinia nivalis]|uniref:Uncharacterized protein n=1 Tax=Sclerotinia nivalis TaxID=352851 RepID=A0A9X0A9C7_9HELO|nr:hypothetical protein OCU04_012745 [Sclerotinia nivalis]
MSARKASIASASKAPAPDVPAPKGKRKAKNKAGVIEWENAPDIQKDPAALAARRGPIDVVFGEIERWNLLPVLGSGIHPVSTTSAGYTCALHALVYSYNAARDLAAPEGTPVPFADSVTVKELIAFRQSPDFWKEAMEYLTAGGQLAFVDGWGEPYSEAEMLEQVKQFIPDIKNNYTIADLHCLLGFLNKRYGTHYSIGDVTQGFNVTWDLKNKVWDVAFKIPTQSMDVGTGIRPVLWLYNDNYEREHDSLHRKIPGVKEVMGHWMGFSTLHRNIDQPLIAQANSWFDDDEVDTYLREGVWIVTEDVEGYKAGLEDHQDPRELRIFKGCFVREPTVAQEEDAPQGYKWVQAGPYVDGGPRPGFIGIVPLKKLKRIERNALRNAHDIARANAVKKDDKGLWIDFYVHRTIEATFKIDRKYANPKEPTKKFVKGFTFEDSEFLLDTQEPLKDLYPRMTKMDGTSGRVKPRNLQFLKKSWGLPEQLPIAAKGNKKKPADVLTPRKKAILVITDKTDARYQYRKNMDANDFKIKDLRLHCQARGLAFEEYGKTKVSMLASLVKHDRSEAVKNKAMEIKETENTDGLPMRRVLADVPKKAGPPKMPPFFATEIVLEIGKGNADDPATWVRDYEGRLGRIDEDNLEPIKGAWGIELDMMRWNQIIGDMRKDAGWGNKSKVQNEKAASKAPAPSKEYNKKRPADESVRPLSKKTKTITTAKAKAASAAPDEDELQSEDSLPENP